MNRSLTKLVSADRNELDLSKANINPSLPEDAKRECNKLLVEYSDLFTVTPRKPKLTNVLKHKIITDNARPQARKQYRIPHAHEKEVNDQVEEMIRDADFNGDGVINYEEFIKRMMSK